MEIVAIEGILATIPAYRQHVRIRSGNPGVSYLPRQQSQLAEAVHALLGGDTGWRSIQDLESFAHLITRTPTCSLIVEGIALEDAVLLDGRLRSRSEYFGVIQVRNDSRLQWAFYMAVLPLRYRIHSGVVSLLYSMMDDPEVAGEDLRDHDWKKTIARELAGSALSVDFASTGLEDTILDPRDSIQDANRAGRMERILGSAFSHVADEIYLRARQIDPGIIEIFDVALRTLEEHDSAEQLSQVALSCRRLLERLADALYPATDEVIDGRKMTQDRYISRLWQYVASRLTKSNADVIQVNLKDVGARIDKLYAVANSGLHGVAIAAAIHRLLINLTTLTFDLLVINDLNAGAAPGYEREQAARIARFVLSEDM
ncbi:hypothetical protein [Amycolatopsis sp. CB00013]|uniref:hypothetical protein n=1 Tax=Amycolatopsis sp. CB00013 TaxID=1703945 RepID=UPI0011614B58|nr:hypothetical protein [Amycolatopsis sp. CB00013]